MRRHLMTYLAIMLVACAAFAPAANAGFQINTATGLAPHGIGIGTGSTI